MEASWPLATQWIIAVEGGKETADGHPTKWGITLEALTAFRGVSCTAQDVFDMKVDEAVAIYHKNYWVASGAASLPYPADLLLFDSAVNEGAAEGTKHIQNACKIEADGKVGPNTINAISSALIAHKGWFIETALSFRGKFYADLEASKPQDAQFERGWLARLFQLQGVVLTGKVT